MILRLEQCLAIVIFARYVAGTFVPPQASLKVSPSAVATAAELAEVADGASQGGHVETNKSADNGGQKTGTSSAASIMSSTPATSTSSETSSSSRRRANAAVDKVHPDKSESSVPKSLLRSVASLDEEEAKAAECLSKCKPLPTTMSSDLPNVLIFGDSVSQEKRGYLSNVRHLLRGIAKVHPLGMFHPDANGRDMPEGLCGASFGILTCLDKWMGTGLWDVISFNWGLHDICPELYGNLPGELYTDRVNLMYQKMKKRLKPGGRVIWHSTTPVPPLYVKRKNVDVVDINNRADAMWANVEDPPARNDLYSAVVNACHRNVSTQCFPEACACGQLQQVDNVHFEASGNGYIGTLVASQIFQLLPKRKWAAVETDGVASSQLLW